MTSGKDEPYGVKRHIPRRIVFKIPRVGIPVLGDTTPRQKFPIMKHPVFCTKIFKPFPIVDPCHTTEFPTSRVRGYNVRLSHMSAFIAQNLPAVLGFRL